MRATLKAPATPWAVVHLRLMHADAAITLFALFFILARSWPSVAVPLASLRMLAQQHGPWIRAGVDVGVYLLGSIVCIPAAIAAAGVLFRLMTRGRWIRALRRRADGRGSSGSDHRIARRLLVGLMRAHLRGSKDLIDRETIRRLRCREPALLHQEPMTVFINVSRHPTLTSFADDTQRMSGVHSAHIPKMLTQEAFSLIGSDSAGSHGVSGYAQAAMGLLAVLCGGYFLVEGSSLAPIAACFVHVGGGMLHRWMRRVGVTPFHWYDVLVSPSGVMRLGLLGTREWRVPESCLVVAPVAGSLFVTHFVSAKGRSLRMTLDRDTASRCVATWMHMAAAW
jgi:hypothetical protein